MSSATSELKYFQRLNAAALRLARSGELVAGSGLPQAWRDEGKLAMLHDNRVRWVTFAALPPEVSWGTFKTMKAVLSETVDKSLCNNPMYEWLAADYGIDERGRTQFSCAVWSELSAMLRETICDYELIAQIKEPGQRVRYFPANNNWWWLGSRWRAAGVEIDRVTVACNACREFWEISTTIVHSLCRALWLYIRPMPVGQNHPQGHKVAFFPHANVYYGRPAIYTKNYLYTADEKSPLHPHRLLHIFFEPLDRLSKRYLRLLGSQWLAAGDVPATKRYCRNFWRLHTRGLLALARGLSNPETRRPAWLVHKMATQLLIHDNLFSTLPGLKLGIAYYDILFPKLALVAMRHHGIISLAVQERPHTMHALPNECRLGFDCYGVLSEDNVEDCRENGEFCVQRYFIAGSWRAGKIQAAADRGLRWRQQFAERWLVIVYDTFPPADSIEDGERNSLWLQGYWKFYQALNTVARELPETRFILMPKMMDRVENARRYGRFKEYLELPNLTIADRRRYYPTYVTAAAADAIIAHCRTSIGDEALMAGKPVLFFENEGFHRAHDHPNWLNGIVVETAEELLPRLRTVLSSPVDISKRQAAAAAATAGNDRLKELIEELASGSYNDGSVAWSAGK